MSLRNIILRSMTCVILFVCISSAQAVRIENNGTLVFYDDFENGTVGAQPDNGDYPGYWNPYDPTTGRGIVIDDLDPGTCNGSKYAMLHYPLDEQLPIRKGLGAMLDSTISEGTVHMEWMVYVPSESNPDYFMQFPLQGFQASDHQFTNYGFSLYGFSAGKIYNYIGYNVDTGVSYTPDVWQKWQIDFQFVSGAVSTFDLTVGKNKATNLAMWHPLESIHSLYFKATQYDSKWYFDDSTYWDWEGAFYPGDANTDTKVDETDAVILAENWLYGPDADWGMGDFNKDGIVDDKDAAMMVANWYVGVETTATPEPSCFVLLLVAALAAMFFHHKLKT